VDEASKPSQVARHVGTVLDDSVHVPIARVVEFELALRERPTDHATRQVYHDWLLEQGCEKRAGELAQDLRGAAVHEYTGPVRPARMADWSGV
jgi:uncharacterized protein (TIGR02996 family)